MASSGIEKEKMLTKEEQKQRQLLFEKYQEEYNKTGNLDLLWNKIYPLIVECCKSNVLKINGSYHKNFVKNFDYKVDDAALTIIRRYVKNKEYHFGSLVTLCYFAALGSSRNKAIQNRDMEESLTHLTEDTDWHESEHIIDFEESSTDFTTEIDGETYFVEDLY